jgi:hypothetical protein
VEAAGGAALMVPVALAAAAAPQAAQQQMLLNTLDTALVRRDAPPARACAWLQLTKCKSRPAAWHGACHTTAMWLMRNASQRRLMHSDCAPTAFTRAEEVWQAAHATWKAGACAAGGRQPAARAAHGRAAGPALTARSPAAALAALPATLPALLRARPWRPAAGALAHRLAQLHAAGTGSSAAAAAGAEGWGGGADGRAEQAGDGAAGGQANADGALVRGVAAACLVALRELLPESGWQQVSRVALEACL